MKFLPSIGVLIPNVLFRVAETKFSNCKNHFYINRVFSFLKRWFSPIGGGTEDSSLEVRFSIPKPFEMHTAMFPLNICVLRITA